MSVTSDENSRRVRNAPSTVLILSESRACNRLGISSGQTSGQSQEAIFAKAADKSDRIGRDVICNPLGIFCRNKALVSSDAWGS